MAKIAIASPKVVKTKGPYVQGVEVTDAKLVFTSGVVARDTNGVIVGLGESAPRRGNVSKTSGTS